MRYATGRHSMLRRGLLVVVAALALVGTAAPALADGGGHGAAGVPRTSRSAALTARSLALLSRTDWPPARRSTTAFRTRASSRATSAAASPIAATTTPRWC